MNNAVSSHFTTLMVPDSKTRLNVDTATGRPPKRLAAWSNTLRNQPLRVRSISREEQAKFEKKADYAIYFKKTATRPSFILKFIKMNASTPRVMNIHSEPAKTVPLGQAYKSAIPNLRNTILQICNLHFVHSHSSGNSMRSLSLSN
ncbi:hypothetical protein V8E54_003576 [Elaphomyces granulatus]